MLYRAYQKMIYPEGAFLPARKSFLWFLMTCLLSSPFFTVTPSVAQNISQGLLVSVSGAVTVRGPGNQPGRAAQKGTLVAEGERVLTSGNASATLKFFDGSHVILGPNTAFSISRLRKLSSLDKILRFKLALGKILAEVAKLGSSKASFEIEAGGVVCGVRGTKFSMDYDPGSGKLDLRVSEGSVYAKAGKTRRVLNAGEGLRFIKGKPGEVSKPPGTAAGGSKSGDQTPSGFADPVFVDLHNQFDGGVLAYHGNTLDDPQAFGLQYRIFTVNGVPMPGRRHGVIHAMP